MTQIEITNISGETPIDVYVSDYLGGDRTFIGTVNTPTSLPIPSSLFNTMSNVMVIMSASNGCETFKVIPCTPQPSIVPSLTPTPTPTPTPLPPFISVWRTTSPNETIYLPLESGGTYSFTVNWGDGNIGTITSYLNNSHEYVVAGDYTVTIMGIIEGFNFTSNYYTSVSNIIEITQWGGLRLGNNEYDGGYFSGCGNLVLTGVTDTLNLNGTTSLYGMFEGSSITTVNNMNSWDVSKVTNMQSMFFATPFNQDISGWDVSNVTNMSGMFNAATQFNQDISSWNVSGVTNMNYMFSNATQFNQDISSWDVSNVTNMDAMFLSAMFFNQDLSEWCVTNIPSLPFLFYSAAGSWTGLPGTAPQWGTCPP
jgi:surface protein